MIRPLRDLLATFENWSAREVNRRVLANAATEREREVMRNALDQGEDVDPLDALRDAAELVALLSGWQWQTMHAARLAGSSWAEIGAAVGVTGEDARDRFASALDAQDRSGIVDTSAYREVL